MKHTKHQARCSKLEAHCEIFCGQYIKKTSSWWSLALVALFAGIICGSGVGVVVVVVVGASSSCWQRQLQLERQLATQTSWSSRNAPKSQAHSFWPLDKLCLPCTHRKWVKMGMFSWLRMCVSSKLWGAKDEVVEDVCYVVLRFLIRVDTWGD